MPSSRPLAGYLRLTQDRHGDKIGHRVQRKAIEAWAERAGVTIGEWYKEGGITAADENVTRPEYERMLADVEAGVWGGIVVWRIDRLTRLSYEYERCHRITKKARAYIATAGDGTTTKDQAGVSRLRRDVDAAETEIANLRTRITANKQIRAGEGLYHGGGRRPYGFAPPKYDKVTGKKVVNTGKVGVKHVKSEVANLREAAERIAWQGHTYSDVIKDWHSRTPPIYGAYGAPWNPKTLQTILTSPRMIGKQVHRVQDPDTGEVTETLVTAAWKPVLETKTWQQLCSMVKQAEHKEGRLRYLLSGIASCGGCGSLLTGATRKYRKGGEIAATRTYRCRSMPADRARGACGKLSVIADPVERIALTHALGRLEESKGAVSAVANSLDLQAEISQANAKVERLNAELGALAEAQQDPAVRLSVVEFLKIRQPLVNELGEAESQLRSLMRRLSVPTPVGADFGDLVGWYEGLTDGQQRKFAHAHIERVTVLPPGRSGRIFKPERVLVFLSKAKQVDGEGE